MMRGDFRGLRGGAMLVVGVAGLLPVVHSQFLFRYFRTPQLAVLLVALGGLAALCLSGSLRWLRSEPTSIRVALGCFGGFFAWMLLAAALGPDPGRSLVGDPMMSTGLVFWAGVIGLYAAAVRFRRSIQRPLSSALLLAGVVLSLELFALLVGGDLVEEFLVPTSQGGIPLPGVGNTALLSAAYAVVVILAAGRVLRPGKGWVMWTILAAAMAGLAVTARSRVALAILLVALFYGAFTAIRAGAKVARVAVLCAALVVSVTVTLLTIVPWLGQATAPSAAAHQDALEGFYPDQVSSGLRWRLGTWRIAARGVAEDPLFGTGPANFVYAYRESVSLNDLSRIDQSTSSVAQDAHNLYVEAAATGGLPALILLFAATTAAVVSLRGRGGAGGSEAIWPRMAAGILFAVHLFQPASLALTPLLAILAGSAAAPSSSSLAGQEVRRRPPLSLRLRRAAGAVAVIGSVFAAFALLSSDYLLSRGSLEWSREDLATSVSLDPTCQLCLYELGKVRSWDFKKEQVGTFAWAIEPLKRAVASHPADAESHWRLGLGLLFLDRPKQAREPLSTARRLDPVSPSAAEALAVAYLRSGLPNEALTHIRFVVEVNPTSSAWRTLADVAEAAGLPDLAGSARMKAEALQNSETLSRERS